MSSETHREKRPVNQNLTVPNALSMLRILLVPFVAYFLLQRAWVPVLAALGISALSDVFDGWIARRFDQVTELGKMLDPLADKLTQGTIALCMAVLFPSTRVFLVLLVIKEFLMLCGAVFLLKKRKRPCASKWFGKLSTVFFYISIALIVLMGFLRVPERVFQIVVCSALGVTVLAMLYSFIRYFGLFREILRSKDAADTIDLPAEIRAKRSRK